MATTQVMNGLTYEHPCNWWRVAFAETFQEEACVAKCQVLWHLVNMHAHSLVHGGSFAGPFAWGLMPNPFDAIKTICTWYDGY